MRRFDLAQQNRSQLATQLQHFPAGTSGRTIVHTAQVPGAAPLSNTLTVRLFLIFMFIN